MPSDNRKTGSDPDAVAFDALGRFGTPEQQHAFITAVARRQAMTEDHTHRISALEGGLNTVVQRVAGVEKTLSDMSSEAARSGAAINAKLDGIAGTVQTIVAKQTHEEGRRAERADLEAKRDKAWGPIVSALASGLVAGLLLLLGLGIFQFVQNVPREVNVEVGPATGAPK